MRLNKYLSDAGLCSRRQADRYIDEGRLSVNGSRAIKGMSVDGSEEILLDGKRVDRCGEKVVIAYHKERGVVCSSVNQGREKNNIVDKINYPIRIYPIGRLDKDSEGLILLTNDGSLVNALLRSRYGHEKEYIVECDRDISDRDLLSMERGGLNLVEGRLTKPCRTQRIGARSFRCILTEGMNRQIRRMCAHFGYAVIRLIRVRFMCVELGDLPAGEYRPLTKKELDELNGYQGV